MQINNQRRRWRKKKVKVAKDGGVRGREMRDKAGGVPNGAHHEIEECVVSEEATGEEKPSEDCREDEAVDEVGVMQTVFSDSEEADDFESGDEVVQLLECDSVAYEKRDGIVGVQFRKEGEGGWTPVTRRRRRYRSGSSSGDEVVIPGGASVDIVPSGGVPGLRITSGSRRTRCSWMPIAARTRNRLKFK